MTQIITEQHLVQIKTTKVRRRTEVSQFTIPLEWLKEFNIPENCTLAVYKASAASGVAGALVVLPTPINGDPA